MPAASLRVFVFSNRPGSCIGTQTSGAVPTSAFVSDPASRPPTGHVAHEVDCTWVRLSAVPVRTVCMPRTFHITSTREYSFHMTLRSLRRYRSVMRGQAVQLCRVDSCGVRPRGCSTCSQQWPAEVLRGEARSMCCRAPFCRYIYIRYYEELVVPHRPPAGSRHP